MSISVLAPSIHPWGDLVTGAAFFYFLYVFISPSSFSKNQISLIIYYFQNRHTFQLSSPLFLAIFLPKNLVFSRIRYREKKWCWNGYTKNCLYVFSQLPLYVKNQVLLYIVQIHLPKQTHFSAPISVIFSSLSTENRVFSFTVNVIEKTWCKNVYTKNVFHDVARGFS